MSIFTAVTSHTDSGTDKLDAKTLNTPLRQLVERTNYLKERIEELGGQNLFEALRSTVDRDATADINSFVYMDTTTGSVKPAIADVKVSSINNHTYVADEGMVVGFLLSAQGNKGTLIMDGVLRPEIDTIYLQDLVDIGEAFRNGTYYLSTEFAGRMTANPKGPAICLGEFFSTDGQTLDHAKINIEHKDLFEAHTHKSFVLISNAAGAIEETIINTETVLRVRGFDPVDSTGAAARLNIGGTWSGSGHPNYDFSLASTDTTMNTAKLSWTTDDASHDNVTGVEVKGYFNKVDLGNGLHAWLEPYESVPTFGAVDLNRAAVDSGSPDKSRWTLQMPDALKGWQGNYIHETMSYGGTASDPELELVLFGEYANPDNRKIETIRAAVKTPGNMNDTVTGVTLEFFDVTNTSICEVAQVYTGKVYKIKDTNDDYDLWFIVRPFKAAATMTSTPLTTDDEWTSTFADEAPYAAFRYNMEFDPAVNSYYPPRPLNDVVIEANGVTLDALNKFRAGYGSYLATGETIYWYDDSEEGSPYNVLSDPDNYLYKNVMLYASYAKAADSGIVTSLKAAMGSNIKIVDRRTGEEATVGDLELLADFAVNIEDSDIKGAHVVKGVSPEGVLLTGQVVEKIEQGSGISLTGTQGTVRISADTNGLTVGEFIDVTLMNARQERIPGNDLLTFIRLTDWDSQASNNIQSFVTSQIRVPYSLKGKYKMVVYATIFGLQDVTEGVNIVNTQYAGLRVTYSVLQDFTNLADPATPTLVQRNLATTGAGGVVTNSIDLLPDVALGYNGDTGTKGYTAFDPVLLHNNPDMASVEGQVLTPFASPLPLDTDDIDTLTAGDIVAIKIERSDPHNNAGVPGTGNQAPGMEYKGGLGIIGLRWKLIEIG